MRISHAGIVALGAIAAIGWPVSGRAQGPRATGEVAQQGPTATVDSTSIGRTNRGRLEGGVLLPPSASLRWRNEVATTRWGTRELVALVEDAAEHVSRTLPGAQLVVGDLSRQGGGRFRPHRSHRNGRDVDIAFYMLDAQGRPAYAPRFVRFRGDGSERGGTRRFDDARNWELVARLLTSPAAHVQWIFVSRPLEERLLAEGRRRGSSSELLARAAAVLDQPSRGGRHDDHFHVRIYCAADDRPRCIDEPPFHPWVAAGPTPPASRSAVARSRPARRPRRDRAT
ncbi:MAG: penicillin-insensitive murein endopeptidase [Myxococcota bacterium]|nr:penicillin-insensitive murein endopeptidase [Myxococcota bacterium]